MMHERRHSAFTLIELLTVLAIVTLLVGASGVATRDGSPTVALESAQATIASLLATARGQAALNQSRATLVVDAEPGNTRFLRALRVAVETSPASGQWRLVGEEARLPRGVFVVPASETFPGVAFAAVDGVTAWPAGRHSTLALTSPGTIPASAENPSARYLGLSAPLTATGTASRDGNDRVVVAAARQTATVVNFDRPESVRTVAISAYGAAIFIDDGPGLDL